MSVSKKLKIPFVCFLVVYFFYLVISNTPAAWLPWMVNKAIPGFWLGPAQGTFWEGRAGSAQVEVPGQEPFALGQVEWRLSPLSILMLKPCIEFSSSIPRQNITGEVCQRLGGTTKVTNLSVDVPIAALNAYMPAELSGDFSLQVLEAEVSSSGSIETLNARYSWQRARASFANTWYVLGSFAGTATQNGSGGAFAELFELEGPYKVMLNGELSDYKRGFQVSGTIAPQENASDNVVQALQLFGEDLGEGRYRVQWP